jgi:hypothetical protein
LTYGVKKLKHQPGGMHDKTSFFFHHRPPFTNIFAFFVAGLRRYVKFCSHFGKVKSLHL